MVKWGLTKAELRGHFLKRRNALGDRQHAKLSSLLCAHPPLHEHLERARIVAAYVPVRGEIDILPLLTSLLANGKTLLLPRVVGPGEMIMVPVTSLESLSPNGAHGIPEPQGAAWAAAVDLALVPGVAFDGSRYRLGYGGGYYDRWLSRQPGLLSIGCFFQCQQCDGLPVEPHDRPLSMIATETGLH